MKVLTYMVLLLITVSYIAIGGIVFHFLEGEKETENRDIARITLNKFLANNTCVSPEELQNLLRLTYRAFQRGQLNTNDTSEVNTNWDYYSAIFFAMTVVTTIGYGNISPETLGGQIFCVAFALVGIPLFLVIAATIGSNFYNLIKRAQKCCYKSDPDGNMSKGSKICANIFYVITGIALFIVVPGIIFAVLEDWTYLEGLYYTFITLTTIGFGDYLAGTDTGYGGFRGIYRLCVAAWIFLGLAWMAGIITSIQDNYISCISDREETASKSHVSRHSRSEGRVNAVDPRYRNDNPRDMKRIISIDKGSGVNGNFSRQNSDVESNPDVYLTKL